MKKKDIKRIESNKNIIFKHILINMGYDFYLYEIYKDECNLKELIEHCKFAVTYSKYLQEKGYTKEVADSKAGIKIYHYNKVSSLRKFGINISNIGRE